LGSNQQPPRCQR